MKIMGYLEIIAFHIIMIVEYRTNRDPNYYKVCVPMEAEYIEDGIFEDAVKVIESGYFNSSYWNNTIFELFRDYSSSSFIS